MHLLKVKQYLTLHWWGGVLYEYENTVLCSSYLIKTKPENAIILVMYYMTL